MSARSLLRRLPTMLRALTAVCLLSVVVGDLAIDADCDPLPPSQGQAVVTEAGHEGDEACAAGCIPDCFCCSRSLAAGPRILPPAPDGVAPVVLVVAPSLPLGHTLLAEHPPRPLA